MAVSSVMVEKDFWVSWRPGLRFAEPALAPQIVFKGGTPSSEVYRVIDRFSQIIDLSMSARRRAASICTSQPPGLGWLRHRTARSPEAR